MKKVLDKEVYRIYKKIMYDGRHRPVAVKHIETADALQSLSSSFSKEQWKAIQDYQTAMMALCNLMVKIALKKH